MLEEAERDWQKPPAAASSPDVRLTHRSERAKRLETNRVALSNNLDGAPKVSSGERRILTGLAQIPAGQKQGAGGNFERLCPKRLDLITTSAP